MSKLLMRVDIVEEEDHIAVKLIATSSHIGTCPNCLATFALRISHAIAERVADLQREEAAEDEDAEETPHPLH